MVNCADQQANQTEELLPTHPETTSPLNSINQNQPFSIFMDRHNSSESSGNYVQNLDDNFSELNNVHDILERQRWQSFMNNCSNSYGSLRGQDRLQESLGSDNSSVQYFQPKKKLLYDVREKKFDSVNFQVSHTRLSEHAKEASNYRWVYFAPTETDVNSGPEAMSYKVNDNRVPCEQTIENTSLDSLPSYPSTSSPLNSLDQASTSLPMSTELRVALDQFKQQQHNGIDSHKDDDVCSITPTDVSITISASCSNHASMTNIYTSWGTNWDDSITSSLAYQYAPSLTSRIEGMESGHEAVPFVVEKGSNIPLQELRENQVEQSNLQVDTIEDIDADPELMPPSNRTSARLVVGKHGAQEMIKMGIMT